MAKQFKITTTGTPTDFNVSGRRIAHPQTDFDLIPEFCYVEIVRDSGFQDAIDSGKWTVKDEDGTTITNIRDQFTPHANSAVFTNSFATAIARLVNWQPNVQMNASELVGYGGASLGVTSNGVHVGTVFENINGEGFQKTATLKNISTNIAYDGSDLELFLTYTLETGQTYDSKNIEFDIEYLLTDDGDDPFTTSTTLVNKIISTTGKSGDTQYTESVGVISGVSGAKLIGLSCVRQNNTFLGDFILYKADLQKA